MSTMASCFIYECFQGFIHQKCYVLFFSSRQRYMLGDGAMIKMAQSKVFLSGLGGLGVEIGKLNAEAQAHYTVELSKGLFYFLAMIRLLQYFKCLSKLGVMNIIYAYRCISISSMHLFNHICQACLLTIFDTDLLKIMPM